MAQSVLESLPGKPTILSKVKLSFLYDTFLIFPVSYIILPILSGLSNGSIYWISEFNEGFIFSSFQNINRTDKHTPCALETALQG